MDASVLLAAGKILIGFVFLIKGADLLVDGASAIARRLHVSDIVIALTIVSFGTSAPELMVNVVASLSGSADMAVGNILGSNIANIFLILGIASIISPLVVQRDTVWKEIPLSLLAAILVGVLVNDSILDGQAVNILGTSDGMVLISFFIVFLYYTLELARKVNGLAGDDDGIHSYSMGRAVVYTVVGIVALPLGGNWIVSGGTTVAHFFQVSESLIGLSIVAVGTSLPEVAASAVAAYRGKSDIAIGNAVGSNIFNIFWVLGLSSLIKPIPFKIDLNTDVAVAAFASLTLFLVLQFGKKHELERTNGIMFLLMYSVYMGFIIYRG